VKHQNGKVEWIRFLLFLFRQGLQDYQDFFACGEGPFGRRPYYPVDPVQLFSLKLRIQSFFKFYCFLFDQTGRFRPADIRVKTRWF